MKSFLKISSVVLLIGFSACTRNDEDSKFMVFRTHQSDDVKTLDPAVAYDALSWEIIPMVYEPLYQYAYLESPYRVVPLIAADLPKISKDRLTLTIPIRKGVYFQDDPCFKATGGKGREVTADDFIRGFKRVAIPSVRSEGWWIFDGKIVGITEYRDRLLKAPKEKVKEWSEAPVEGLQALDSHTLQIKLTKPYPQLLFVLTMPFTSPMPQEAVEAYADENLNLHNKTVGTGPFRITSWRRGHQITAEKNPNFHPEFYPTDAAPQFQDRGMLEDAGKRIPFIDKIIVDVLKEEQPAWLEFIKGKLDRLHALSKDNFQTAIVDKVNLSSELQKKKVNLVIDQGGVLFFLNFNMKDKLLGQNKALRQAISSAINREELISLFSNGRDLKMNSILPPGVPGYSDQMKLKYDFNLNHAKTLLAQAGYPEGKGLEILKIDMRGADTVYRQMGEYFVQSLAKIGIRAQIIHNTFPAFLEKTNQGHFQIAQGGWQLDYPDAENMFQLVYGPNSVPGPNTSSFDDDRINRGYEKIAQMSPGPDRSKLLLQMDAVLQEECPWVYLYYKTSYRLGHSWLKNYRGSQIIPSEFKYYRIDQGLKKQLKPTF